MGMLKIDVFSVADRQNFLALLNVSEAAGITDIRFLREQIQKSITDEALKSRLESTHIRKEDRIHKRTLPRCPKCNSVRWRTSKDLDGELYTLCKDCQYSELVK